MITLSESLSYSLEEFLDNKKEDINLNNIKIEKFSSKYKSHLKEINKLQREMDSDDNGSSLDELNKGPNYCFIYNNDLVGYVVIEKQEKDRYSISSFIIKPEYRGKGTGKYCFELLLKFIKEKFNPKIISLWVYFNNDPARSIYYSFGFKPYSTEFEGDLQQVRSHAIVQKSSDKTIIKELREIYKNTNKSVPEDMLPPSSALVLLDKDNKVLAGSGFNNVKENNAKYLTLFYPVGLSQDNLKTFLEDIKTHKNLVGNADKFNLLSYNDYQFFNVFKNFGKPKQEELYLNL